MKIKQIINPITGLFILLNIIIFVWLIMQYGMNAITGLKPIEMLHAGGTSTHNNPFNWLTSLFVHGSLPHFATNMIFFYILGYIVESNINRYAYSIIYLLSGIIANLIFEINNIGDVAVGASGSIAGILGALIVLTFDKNHYNHKILQQLRPMTLCITIIFFISTIFVKDANLIIHITGFIVGIIATIGYIKIRQEKNSKKSN